MSQKYTLKVMNNSTNKGNICVYQSTPETTATNVMSLAWFSEYAFPTTTVIFDWSLDYQFMWDETGTLKPGIVFDASQVWDADLTSNNMVTLHYDQAYTFKDQHTNSNSAGNLVITQDETVPLKMAAVGIGMSGAGAFAFEAQPNTTLVFTPHPEYWITFGNYQKGEILDITAITNQAKVAFPPNVYSMTAFLMSDNTWSVVPSAG
jgi:hypothetical protein